MDKLVVCEGPPLRGEVPISGAKNAVLPILAATLLTDEPCVIDGAPRLRDVNTMIRLLAELGLGVEWEDSGSLRTVPSGEKVPTAPYGLVKQMRASITVLGPLVAHHGEARVSFPGGCSLGPRPIDLHLKGLKALGADIDVREGYIEARAKRLRGCRIYLGGPFGSTVTGTANVLMAAVLAEGRTVIEGAACEPEVVDLGRFLTGMGARIRGIGSPRIVVEGVDRLSGCRHCVISDRIEAGTFLAAGAITGGDVTVRGVEPDLLLAVLERLERTGASVSEDGDRIRVTREGPIRSIEIVTLPYPGFPTDLQAQFMALLALAEGVSVITERIYPERFMHVAELMRMRARIRKEGASAIVVGRPFLSGAPVMASDLRASAALVLAGLVARGETHVHRVYHIDRGYERIEEKLGALGALVTREEDSEAP